MKCYERSLAIMFGVMIFFTSVPATGTLHASSQVDVEIWTDYGYEPVLEYGQEMDIYFRTEADCYITIYQIDTDGNVYLLYPAYSNMNNFVRGGVVYCLSDLYDGYDYYIDSVDGIAYISAFACPIPYSVPRWLRPHPYFLHERVYYYDYYQPIVCSPYWAMEDIHARFCSHLGISVHFGFGHFYFYVGNRVRYPVYIVDRYHRHAWYRSHTIARKNVRRMYRNVERYTYNNRRFYSDGKRYKNTKRTDYRTESRHKRNNDDYSRLTKQKTRKNTERSEYRTPKRNNTKDYSKPVRKKPSERTRKSYDRSKNRRETYKSNSRKMQDRQKTVQTKERSTEQKSYTSSTKRKVRKPEKSVKRSSKSTQKTKKPRR